ncbi:MAG: VOC family protein [Gemmatimonadetes bacterium]|nr:VOC family protein [Gemmatimonadota bacterium]MCY3612950.1 VOC family protein [Gemmatimonadota bacterium]MCY3677029.1 VOC family protein [Gemmatimonadota bacterium]
MDSRLNDLPLDHVAVAVRSFTDTLPVLERLTGARASAPERVPAQGVEVCFVGRVELIRPLDGNNGVARFIDRRGPGLHHVAYRVEDVGAAMTALESEGYEFTSARPMTGAGGHRIAFVHPRSTGGLLVELVERG